MSGCVFSRQMWPLLFRHYGLPDFSPFPDDKSFFGWWMRIISLVPANLKRGLNSLLTLGAWMLWKHRNDCVFNGANPNVQAVLRNIFEEAHLWYLVGARSLTLLEVSAR
uniref:Reverse transcriptase zinc-binding domain-containing protein n=1 Tax=Arundo donax TaxID=35708 RepID=A0A0A8XPK6_ARUDO